MEKRKIGPFELEGKLGVGGMGVVYLATYLKTGQKLALKVLSPAFSADRKLLTRFEREMEILKRLRHPHIVQYYGGGRHSSQHFYAMELMTGGSLDQRLRKRGRLPWEQVIEYGLQICKALEHAHHHGIVHRDLKPANLFLAKDGTLKLGDFGIARDTEATALTAAGRTVGTYAYMAPEQITGKPPVSRKTDLYALGCVLYELLTGQPPFRAETSHEMFTRHLQDEPPRVTATAIDCPVWLEAVVMRLLQKDPEDRYFDALAVQVALQEVGEKVAEQASLATQTIAGGAAGATAGGRPELDKLLGRKKKKRRKRGPFYEQVWFLAACLLLLVGGVTWAMWPLGEDELFARAEPLMASEQHWDRARKEYLEPLLKRFPEGQYAPRAREYLEQIDLRRIERQAENIARLNRDPRSEAERLYVEALKSEQARDRITALAKYRGLVEILRGREGDDRYYVLLAQRRVAEIEAASTQSHEGLELINEALDMADVAFERGDRLRAETIWRTVVDLYRNNQEFELLVNYARDRLEGREAVYPEILPAEHASHRLPAPPSDEVQDVTHDEP